MQHFFEAATAVMRPHLSSDRGVGRNAGGLERNDSIALQLSV
jgi:hypothetical protein